MHGLATIALVAYLLTPIKPVSYSMVSTEEEKIFSFVLKGGAESASCKVDLFYKSGQVWTYGWATSPVSFAPSQIKTVVRRFPLSRSCPCILCVTQSCPAGYTASQCVTIMEPLQPLPVGATPFTSLESPICNLNVNQIMSNGFESGSIASYGWKVWP